MTPEQSELKQRIKDGWDLSAPGFTEVVVPTDLYEPGRSMWTKLILEKAPQGRRLKVLDVGCGPGVFSILMAMAGHDAVGIDVSDRMVLEARKNSDKFGVSPEFLVMDSDDMSFPDGEFDIIVSRDAMWVMPDPDKTMNEWFRVLKHGGRIIYFDGKHAKRDADFDIRNEYQEAREIHEKEKNSSLPCSYKPEEFEKARGFKRDLPLTYVERPAWDNSAAERAGFADIDSVIVNEDIGFISEDNKYDCYTRFRLVATKP